MTKKVYTVTDLGPGDGGKGGVVHKIATMMRAHTVVKVGGAQGSHGVRTSRGESFAFSQWGCGTFEGINTHISARFIVSPEGLLNESDALRYQHGIHNPFGLLTVDEMALCATPYHGIASRLKEMSRGNNPRGTIGTGVGEAYRYLQQYPDLTIRACDLSRPDLKDLLVCVREQIRSDLNETIGGEFLPSDREAMQKEVALLYDDGFLDYIAERFEEVSRRAKIVGHEYLEREVLARDGVVVVESSHGVITDHFHGFYPHVSAIRTLPCFTQAMLIDAGYDGEIVNFGVFRAYAIRHGAGPMPTANPEMAERLLPGSHKESNRYQGEVRVGALDLVLLRYAIEVCGGPNAFNGLAVTWFDQIVANGEWRICDRYLGADDPTYFTPTGAIKVRVGTDNNQLEYQESLGKQLSRCKPEITTLKVPSPATPSELYSFCASIIGEKLGVQVRMISLGSTERDKMCR
ncbi:MAG: adenylosuccinate synthetase [Candidatus Spechtbacteria bacterium]|nr:adenylosuccinate synthetase [Candidatus Spechtbacteria bacterium]